MHHEALTDEGKTIWPLLKRFDGFYLAGGTALALQIGHRVSVDFDLFSPEDINKNLLSKVKKVFQQRTVYPSVNNPDELTVLVGNVKITFLKYPFLAIEDLVVLDGIPTLSVKEIAATKAYAIGRRGTFKDYIDLYFIISENYASLKETVDLADKKFAHEFNSRLFLEQLIFMDDISEIEIKFLKDAVSPKTILDFFTEQIKVFPL